MRKQTVRDLKKEFPASETAKTVHEKWTLKEDASKCHGNKQVQLQSRSDAAQERWSEKEERWSEKRDKTSDSNFEYDASTSTYTIAVGISAAELNALIAEAEPGATFILEDGTHEFTETIIITRDDITLKGESEEGTILNFSFPEGSGDNAIEITGGEKTKLTELSEPASAGSYEIIIEDASGIEAGDTIYISQPNTEEYLQENDWENVSFDDADQRPFREYIVRVEAVDGNTLKLAEPLPYDFDASETDIYEIDMVEAVTLQDFTITSGIDETANYNDFVNDVPEYENTSVVMVNGADGMVLNNITIIDAPSNGFDFRSTLDLEADGLSVYGSHNLGGGGNGYGIQLYETFGATLTDVEVYDVRHAVIFSSWHAETGNYVEISGTNRDVNFHGSPDVDNQVLVNSSILEYEPEEHTGAGNGFWDIVSTGGSAHATTDIYSENSVTFVHAEGHNGSEIIYGADGGAYLDGNGSQDVLIGGDGNDFIIGGTSSDILTGGSGADIFVFEVGDAYDTITDFSGDFDRDVILFAGEHDLQSFDDLRLRQEEEDAYVTYGSSSTIILANYDVTKLEAEYFVFDPYGNDGLIV